MTLVSAIEIAGALAGLFALLAAAFPRPCASRWHPRGFVVLLAAVLTGSHILSAIEHMGLAEFDRMVDFARLSSPILWFFLLYSWLQSDAARRLSESEERFRLFMNHSPTEAFIKDEQGRYIFGNKTWSDRFGKPIEDLLGKTDFDLWPQATARLFRKTDELARTENRPVRKMESGIGSDGHPRWFEVFKFPIPGPDGQNMVAGIVLDITDMRRAEIERNASDQRYRLMFESSPLPMWICDIATLRFIDVNNAAIHHYGYSRAEFLAMTARDIRPSEDPARPKPLFENRQTNQGGAEIARHVRKDATIIDVAIHSNDVTFEGKVVRLVVAIDVTERQRAESALRESRQLLEKAQQVGKIGSWWSEASVGNGQLDWSPQMHRIFGTSEDTFDHRVETFYRLVHPDDRESVRMASLEAVQGGKPYEIDHRLIRPDGVEIWVHERADVIRDENGKAIRMVGISQDITERKQFDDMLMQIAKGVSADTGDTFFRSLVQHLVAALKVDFAFVAELVPEQPTMVRTIAVGGGGGILLDNFSYQTMQTPCEMTLLHQNFSVPSDVAARFPRDAMLRDLDVESYIGSTLRGADNQPIGLIAVMNRRPNENLQAIEAMLQIFGVRAAAELNRLMTEKALHQSKQRLGMALRGAQLGVWDYHIPSGVVTLDDRWREMLGYEERDIEPVIQSWEKMIHPEDHARVMGSWASHIAGHTNYYESEYRLLAKSGKWKWILDQGMVVERDEAGQPLRAVGTHMDIDDRRRAAAAIEEWKSRYDAAIHASRQIMYDWNTHTHQIAVAGATERLIGCPPDDLNTLEKWEARVHPEDLPAFQEEVRRVAGSFEPFHLEYRVRRNDGSYLEAEDHGFFFADADGKRTRMVGFLSDITSRKQAERERRRLEMELNHKQKMEAVGNLASGIAHDFGNVLTAIQGHLALALRGLLPDHPARKSLSMVEQAARQGVDMTRSITTFGHKMPSDKTPCALVDLVADSLRLFRHLLPGNVDIQFSKPANAGPWIHAARSQIQQVVMNLIFNARDAMPAGGILRVRVAAVARARALSVPSVAFAGPNDPTFNSQPESANLSVADNVAVLSVVDTGCGMDEHTLRRLFEPFFTTKDRQHGTGLGLAMVHGIITAHGGWIAVASMPGKGSRFDLFLPMCLASPSEPAQAHVVANIPAHRPRFILVLYPNDFVLEIMTTSLESSGYVIVVAQSPDHLAQLVCDHGDEVGAIIVDADSLPESDQPPVFALQAQVGDVPLVVLSSNMARFLDEPQAAGLSILPKPFQMSKLISLVDRAVGVIPSGAQ